MSFPSSNSPIPFYKMEGCGNDYIFIDIRESSSETPFRPTKKEIIRLTNRNTGIGGDGLVIISQNKKRETSMLMWNADGSHSDMCGNALRCIALLEHKKTKNTTFSIQSGKQSHKIRILESTKKIDKSKQQKENYSKDNLTSIKIEVEMGSPLLRAEDIPFNPKFAKDVNLKGLISATLEANPFTNQKIYTLSIGNPHCILFFDDDYDLEQAPLENLGSILEVHPAFPQRCNVSFCVNQGDGLRIRTFERGSGETMACGSAACAVHVASVLKTKSKANALQKIYLRGGELEIKWIYNSDKMQSIFMRGPARLVYSGEFKRSDFKDNHQTFL